MKHLYRILAGLFFIPLICIQEASAESFTLTPSSDKLFVASRGEVMLTFVSKTAVYSNDLFLSGAPSVILNNQVALPGSKYSLGNFEAGQQLSFEMFVNNTNTRYFTGSAELNPDKQVHAAFYQQLGQPLIVGFEDLWQGGDRDYDDLVFSLSNVSLSNTNIAPVPEPESYAMLMLGFGLLALASSRQKRTRSNQN